MNQPDVPILGQPKPTHAMAPGISIVRHLDEQGLLPLVDGHVERSMILDGGELLSAIEALMRRVVREELRLAKVDADA